MKYKQLVDYLHCESIVKPLTLLYSEWKEVKFLTVLFENWPSIKKLWYPLRDIINDEHFNCLEYEESLCYWGEEGY